MKRISTVFLGLALVIILLLSSFPGLAQTQRSPLLYVLGTPETQKAEGSIRVAVVDPNTGRGMTGLENNFQVSVAGDAVTPKVLAETTGIALAIVIDRGGISRQGDPRIGHAIELADQLLQQLRVDGTPNADLVALVGVAELEKPENWNLVGFTDYDPQLIRNEFEAIRAQPVAGVTPLFNGIDQAVEWMIRDAGVGGNDTISQEDLDRRRRVIVVFSDGIDNKFSDRAHQLTLIQKCREDGIMLYTVRLEHAGRTTGSATLEVLASETYGRFERHLIADNNVRDKVLRMFSDIATQRETYQLVFPFHKPQGSYDVNIRVDTPLGNAQAQTRLSSPLRLPQITLTSPQNGLQVTVPYSSTLEPGGAYEAVSVGLGIAVNFPDNVERGISRVRYYADSQLIGEGATESNSGFEWELSSLVVAASEPQTRTFTLLAEATDSTLEQRITSEPVSITVIWEPLPPPTLWEQVLAWLQVNWWLLLILAGLLIGLIILFVLNARMKGELGRKIRTSTTGVLKGMTRPLAALSAPAQGKLVIMQGAGIGKEYRLSGQMIKVGRDPQFCDFALYDEYVSNPHFNVYFDQGNYYIEDAGSRNQTRLNGTIIAPNQRQFLQPDAIIEVGATRLQFKRLGGNTRQLQQPGGGVVYPSTPPAAPGAPGWGGSTQAAPGAGLPLSQPYPPGSPPAQPMPGAYPSTPPQTYPAPQAGPGGAQWGQQTQPYQQPPGQPGNPNQPKP